jgi:hypothetical protein
VQPDAHPAGGDTGVSEALFYQKLREVLAATWPEATEHGFYRGIQIARVPLEKLAPKLPVVAIDAELRNTTEWGLANHVDAGQVTIYYVGDDGLHVEDDLLPKLAALRDALWPSPALLEFGQVIERPSVSVSMNLPLNRHFLGVQKPLVAGAVLANVLVQEVG